MNSPESSQDQYGIRICMPADDPLSAPHLLGESWNTERWFSTGAERDRVLAGMLKQPPYYRKGDSPSVVLEKIERSPTSE